MNRFLSPDENSGLQASVDGFAHEHIVVGLLMKKYQNVSLVDLPLSTYDIIIVMKKNDNKEEIIRAQVKTSKTALSFTGGTRGGVDCTYKSGIKTYRQSAITSDVVIGIEPLEDNNFSLFFFPTLLVDEIDQGSISLNRIKGFENNYDLLERCQDSEYVLQKAREYGLIGRVATDTNQDGL